MSAETSSTAGASPAPARDGLRAALREPHPLLLLLLLLAFALRIFLLDAQSIWWDEGISLHLAASDFGQIAADRLDNIHPPLYFFLLKVWLTLTGVTAFSARYLSVLAGWLQVALTYAVAARWFGRRTGLAAALFATVSAVSIIYAQETRVYSLLPLAYLALLAVTRELTRPAKAPWILWLALALISWLAIHLHYVSFFAVGYVTIWAAVSFSRRRRWTDLRRLVLVQLLAAAAGLPWFLPAAANRAAIAGEANAGTFVTDAVPFRFLVEQVWTFHLTGLAGALARSGIPAAAGITALLLLLAVTMRLADGRTRRATAVLLANWLLPLSSALLVWLVRSFSHPRYVVMFVPGLWLLAAYLIAPGPRRTSAGFLERAALLLSVLLALLLLTLSLWGIALYFFDPSAAKDDIRGAAAYLETIAEEGDLILVPDSDWSLPFEYAGEAQVAMPGLENGENPWGGLAQLTAAARRVHTFDYARGTRDWQELLPFALHKAGRLSAEVALDDLILRTYELDEPLSAPPMTPAAALFGPLQLTGFWVEEGAPAEDALALALRWQPAAGEALPRVNAALRLQGEEGRLLAAEDDVLLDSRGRPSDQWPPQEPVTTYHLLPLAPGTAPLTYSLAVELYSQEAGAIRPLDLRDEQGAPAGRTLLLPGVETGRPAAASGSRPRILADSVLADPIAFAPGLVLQEAAPLPARAAPGTPLQIDLVWQATAELPDLRPLLLLAQGQTLLAANDEAPFNGRYPTSSWQVGELVHEPRTLLVPAGSSGEAQLILQLGETSVKLGEVSIEAQDYLYEPPQMAHDLDIRFGDVARLAGYSVEPRPHTAAKTLPLTLLWESLSDGADKDYVVFAHLLDADGRLIAQHDGPPVQGARPTRGWVSGEYLLDVHEIAFLDPAYAGPAWIEVGLYDPAGGERIPLSDGADHALLPLELIISAQE